MKNDNFKFIIIYGFLMGLGLYPFMYLSLAQTTSTSWMILVMQFSKMKASKVMMGNVVMAIHPLTSNALKFNSFLDIIDASP